MNPSLTTYPPRTMCTDLESGEPDDIFCETKIPLDKRLAHLTWQRLPWSPGKWNLAAMKASIDRLVDLFKGALAADQANWFSPSALTVTRGRLDTDAYSTVSWGRI